MVVGDHVFEAFVTCPTKGWHKITGTPAQASEYVAWLQAHREEYQHRCCDGLQSSHSPDTCMTGTLLAEVAKHSHVRLLVNCVVETPTLASHIPAIECPTPSSSAREICFVPVRFLAVETITKAHRLLLAFDALAICQATGSLPTYGKLVYGQAKATTRVELQDLIEEARLAIAQIATISPGQSPPELVLIPHCRECEFEAACHATAVANGDLSLLSSMTATDRKKQHSKGIFTLTQLSYTYRPRRPSKNPTNRSPKHQHALQALALRENKIHVTGTPQLTLQANCIFLDVEGMPGRELYYLIGLRVKRGDAHLQYSLWANNSSELPDVWRSFLDILAEIDNPQLVYYGRYETIFLKQMLKHYGCMSQPDLPLAEIIEQSVNLLKIIYGHIYFPVYSNGLKDIAKYLGFKWTDSAASGRAAIMLRHQWEASRDSSIRERLITYNAEDCQALELVTGTVVQLCGQRSPADADTAANVVHTDSLPQSAASSVHLFKANEFVIPELKYINEAAYWDHQRDRVYIKSSHVLKSTDRNAEKHHAKPLAIDRELTGVVDRPSHCPRCGGMKIQQWDRHAKIVYDLKFLRAGVRRQVVKYYFSRYKCLDCKRNFAPENRPWVRSKFGLGLSAYVIYQAIELQLPQSRISGSLRDLFDFDIRSSAVSRLKAQAAERYRCTYELILRKLVSGGLLHADETKVDLKDRSGYVWVLTSLEDVIYFYTDTREGDALRQKLVGFGGVLVSDFYKAYDSIGCRHQKCLIHLLRDLNDDLVAEPFNEELRQLAQSFADVVRQVVETVDRFGLKAHCLRRHRGLVDGFHNRLQLRELMSESANRWQKRLVRCWDELFTFMECDGVPWNNNNAEHAIKAFATLRNTIQGNTSVKGIRDYLTLLSICESCTYKGVSFLTFLRSGATDIDQFIGRKRTGLTDNERIGASDRIP